MNLQVVLRVKMLDPHKIIVALRHMDRRSRVVSLQLDYPLPDMGPGHG